MQVKIDDNLNFSSNNVPGSGDSNEDLRFVANNSGSDKY